MRLFFALMPDLNIRARFAALGAQMQLTAPARPVAADNIHVTLAFIGEVAASGLERLRERGSSHQVSCVQLRFDSVAFWPASKAVVALARENPVLLSLAAQLQLGSEHVQQAPRLHVTLARKVSQLPVLKAMSPLIWDATSFSLVRSDTAGDRSVYTVVDTWPLLDKR